MSLKRLTLCKTIKRAKFAPSLGYFVMGFLIKSWPVLSRSPQQISLSQIFLHHMPPLTSTLGSLISLKARIILCYLATDLNGLML